MALANLFAQIFGGGGSVSSATAKPAIGDTVVRGQVPAGATATFKKNGTVLGAATVTAQGAASYTLSSALVAGDQVSFPWTLMGESPAATATAAPTLGALSVSPSTATVGAAYSGTISGGTAGSTFSLSGATAGLSVSGTSITGTPTTAGAVNLIEALAGATNSPRTTSGALTVSTAAPPPSGSSPGQISTDLSDPNSIGPRV